jgi:hypothetical protein
LGTEVVDFKEYTKDIYDRLVTCECGCVQFLVTAEDGLICLECDGRLINFKVEQLKGWSS